jgi:hypothetical protein
MTPTEPVLTPRAQRFPFRIPLTYRKSDGAHWHTCKTVNISRTGILFRSDEDLEESLTLDIRVLFPLQKTLCCQGTVVRSQKSSYAVRIYHCQFKSATDSMN